MGTRTVLKQSEHDDVVRASATTYGKLEAEGYKVSTNPDGEKNFGVGPAGDRRYPDVLVWMPSAPGATGGTVKIIEEVETEDSVTEEEAEQWHDYASLGIEQFFLIVPRGSAQLAAAIVDKRGIRVTGIYVYERQNGSYRFEKYR